MRRTLVLLPVLALAGCGSTHARTTASFTTSSYGRGAARVWVFSPAGRPRAVAVFVHGRGDAKETTPYYHRPWLEHLARRGVEVLYPRYETFPGEEGALVHMVAGLKAVRPHLRGRDAPVVEIGYSRGGRLVAELATLSRQTGFRPSAVLSIFPSGAMDPEGSLAAIPHTTKFVMLVGDSDNVVGTIGVTQLATQLARSGFPFDSLRLRTVHSHGSFVATHLSVLERTPAARAAYWAPADRLIDSVAR